MRNGHIISSSFLLIKRFRTGFFCCCAGCKSKNPRASWKHRRGVTLKHEQIRSLVLKFRAVTGGAPARARRSAVGPPPFLKQRSHHFMTSSSGAFHAVGTLPKVTSAVCTTCLQRPVVSSLSFSPASGAPAWVRSKEREAGVYWALEITTKNLPIVKAKPTVSYKQHSGTVDCPSSQPYVFCGTVGNAILNCRMGKRLEVCYWRVGCVLS